MGEDEGIGDLVDMCNWGYCSKACLLSKAYCCSLVQVIAAEFFKTIVKGRVRFAELAVERRM